jgi:predicted deacylase
MPFLGVDPAPGTQQRARIELGEALDGSAITLPVAVLRGSHDGPTVYLQAGLHGDELTGIDICRRALASLDAAALNGTVAVIPVANPSAHRSRSRGWRHEERGPIDANRVFPGAEHGLMTERIVHTLFHEFVALADFTLDLHSALDGCTIAPFVYIDPDDDETGTLALREGAGKAFGTPYLYYKGRGQKLGTSDMARALRAQADLLGKASISAEMGESLRVTRDYVPLGVQGVINVLRFLGVLDGDPVPPPAPPRVFRTITLAHADRGGGLRWRIAHRDDVRAGQPIADIVDVFGEPVATVESPADGFLLRQMLWGTVATGGEVAWIAS